MTPADAAGAAATAMLPPDSLKPRLQEAIGADYVVESEIGQGGFAHVFSVTDRKLQRRIAVKVLRPEFTANADSVRRFIREAESAAKINHPHILPIYFVGEKAGLVYFAMPLVDGETLDARLRREGQLAETEVIRLGSEIADALAEAHTHGLVHRDIKPQNVMLQGPKKRAMVMDFGIAKAAAGSGEKLTGTGVIIGSPHYMSPEQAGGDPEIDKRSDLYSLGIVLWEMLAGEVPFDGPSTQGILIQHLTQSVPPIRTRRPNVTAALARVVARTTEKKKDDRFEDASALSEALKAAGSVAGPASSGSSLGSRLSRALIGTVAAAALVLSAVVWLLLKPGPGPVGDRDAAHGSPRTASARVAVLPLEALVATNPAQFSRSTAQLLTDALSSRYQVPTSDGHELLGHWTADGLKTDAPLDQKAAFAYEHGANQMVLGSAVESGRQLRLSIDLYDTHDLTHLNHADVTGNGDSLFSLVERLGEIIAGALCSQPDYNPANRCYDRAAHPVDSVSVSDVAKAGEAAPTSPVFLVHVDSTGTADNVRLKTGSSHDDVNGAALAAVREARYLSARLRGKPVSAWTTVAVQVYSGAAAVAAAEPAACARPGYNDRNACFDKRPAPMAEPVVPWTGTGSPSPAIFWVRVSGDGDADTVRVLTASSEAPFTAAAERMVRGLTFTPALKAGRPVAAWTQVAIMPQ